MSLIRRVIASATATQPEIYNFEKLITRLYLYE